MKQNIYEILRRHYPETEYALLTEVRNAAGYNASRSADFMAMNLWPSRGLSVHGLEMKSFRGDWLKELKSPDKAEAIFKYCDYWWLLTTNENVAKLEEIPEQWGWKHITNGKVKIIKQAPKLSPVPLDRNIVACMLKRGCDKSEFVHSSSIQDRIVQAKLEGEEQARRYSNKAVEQLKIIQQNISEFEQYSGINLGEVSSWRIENYNKIGKAAKYIANNGVTNVLDQIKRMQNILENLNNGLKSQFELIEKESESFSKIED